MPISFAPLRAKNSYRVSQQILVWFWAKKLNFESVWSFNLRWEFMISLNKKAVLFIKKREVYIVTLTNTCRYTLYYLEDKLYLNLSIWCGIILTTVSHFAKSVISHHNQNQIQCHNTRCQNTDDHPMFQFDSIWSLTPINAVGVQWATLEDLLDFIHWK